MTEHASQTATDAIRLERLLDAPVETVWEWLVDSEKRCRWFAAGKMEPRVGGDLELIFDHDNLSADDVPYPPEYAKYKGAKSQEKIVRFDPPHLLAFTFGNEGKAVAEFALSPEGERTRLVLTQTGLTKAERADNGAGWYSHLAVLEAKLAGREVRDFWALHKQSEAAFAREDEQA